MKHITHRISTLRRRTAKLHGTRRFTPSHIALAVAAMLASASAVALPSGGVVTSGNASAGASAWPA